MTSPGLIVVLSLAVLLVVVSLVWRVASQRRSLPCPSWLAWLLDNPFSNRLLSSLLERLELSPGLRVLDAGCGPGRFTVPIARAVGGDGRVLAVDIQPKMLERARARVASAGVENVDFLLAGLGEGELPAASFDRALLVTVLGEIPDRGAALREIFSALVPGGFLLVGEMIADPHYQSVRRVASLGEAAGFRVGEKVGGWLAFRLVLEKPGSA